jgi:hypothetical protein
MPWGTRLGEVELGAHASPAVAHAAFLGFLQRVFGRTGLNPPASAPIAYFDNVGGWRSSQTWPPAHRLEKWHGTSGGGAASRHGGGRLVPGNEASTLAEIIVSEPLAPYPGGLTPLSDEAAAEDRRDVWCFTTAELEEPMSLVGSVTVSAVVNADVATHDLIASIVVVGAADTARRLATGATRVRCAPDQDHEVVVQLSPIGWTLRAGERLRVDVSASRFPAYDRNPQSTATPVALTPREGFVVATLHLSELRVELLVAADVLPIEEP